MVQTESDSSSSPRDAAERLDVLFGLLLDDVDDVVEGQHADQALAVVDHRRRDQIVALEHARHLLLVVGGADPPAVVVHQLGDRHRPLGAQQPVERHRAEQLAAPRRPHKARRNGPADPAVSRMWSMAWPTVQDGGTAMNSVCIRRPAEFSG